MEFKQLQAFLTRRIILGAGIVILSLLSLHSRFAHPWVSVSDCLANPEQYQGRQITHFREPMIASIDGSGFELKQKNGPGIYVFADTSGLMTNQYIGLIGTFSRDSTMTAESLVLCKQRRNKIIYSVLPVLLVAYFILSRFRMNWSTLTLEERNA